MTMQTRRRSRRRYALALFGASTVFFCLTLTTLITTFFKLYVGYQRPHFYDRCGFNFNYNSNSNSNNEGFECTHFTTNVRESFPSGHASMSFAGLMFLSLFIWECYQPRYDNNNNNTTTNKYSFLMTIFPYSFVAAIHYLIGLIPVLVAGWVASSRVVDNHHFPADIVCGSVLGTIYDNKIHDVERTNCVP